jgi:hypothetical protein
MPSQLVNAKAQKEARILLAINVYKKGHFPSIRKAADIYTIDFSTLAARLRVRVSRAELRSNYQKLIDTEEEFLER